MAIYDHSEDDKIMLSVSDQEYTRDDLEDLMIEHNIIYDGHGVHAFRVIPRDGDDPLIQLFGEDDGCLYSTDIMFDLCFIDSMVKNLLATKQYCIDNNLYSNWYARRTGLEEVHEQPEQD